MAALGESGAEESQGAEEPAASEEAVEGGAATWAGGAGGGDALDLGGERGDALVELQHLEPQPKVLTGHLLVYLGRVAVREPAVRQAAEGETAREPA